MLEGTERVNPYTEIITMAASDRFYQIQLPDRFMMWGDIGNIIQIAGIIVQGAGRSVMLMTPDSSTLYDMQTITLSVEEWSAFIRHSDDPSVFELDATGGIKAVHRKLRYQISGAVQQKIWARDGFKCMFCKREMGDVQLTIDHFEPLELGGVNDQSNYLSACRKCNKRKGNMTPQDWCRDKDYNYDYFVEYLAANVDEA